MYILSIRSSIAIINTAKHIYVACKKLHAYSTRQSNRDGSWLRSTYKWTCRLYIWTHTFATAVIPSWTTRNNLSHRWCWDRIYWPTVSSSHFLFNLVRSPESDNYPISLDTGQYIAPRVPFLTFATIQHSLQSLARRNASRCIIQT